MSDDPLESLRENYAHVYEYVIVAKAIDSEDEVVLAMAASPSLSPWEVVGMLETASHSWATDFQRALDGPDDDYSL